MKSLEPLPGRPWGDTLPSEAAVLEYFVRRDPWSRYRKPRYQTEMMLDLAALLPIGSCTIIDIGSGSGLIGEAIASLLPGKSVTGVDVAARTKADLSIPFARFDGSRLPFRDRSFDCALFCNVLHHVKPEGRIGLLREAMRVTGGGPVVVKDHLASRPLDGFRLWLLDFVGNAPHGAMVAADYLGAREWEDLLRELDCAGVILPVAKYRRSLWTWCLPNRLEICFRARARGLL
ncbi:MAG TPA: class I SAM-dependent methyltransferase [Burkholderiales bacterium]|nr:class I SAM-dependent methyltransferase [Burkholderiales bacterium]